MSNIKIKKLKVDGSYVYPATILDAVKDATTTSATYGKTVRLIIEDNEKTTATALTELDGRVGLLSDLKTTAKGSVVAAINEILTAAGVTSFDGKSGAITVDSDNTANGSVNLAVSDGGELSASVVGLQSGAFAEISTALPESEDKCSDTKVASEKELYSARMTILDAVVGTSTTQPDGTNETLTSIDERVDAIETTLNVAGTDQATIDKVDEVLTWFSGVQESDAQGAAIITAAAAVGTKGSGDTASTGLIKDVEDLQAVGATKVEASTTNGNIKINGTETTVYTPETGTVVDTEYAHVTVSATDGVTANGVTYKYTPEAGTVVDSAYSHITVSSTGVSDAAGNTYSFTESSITVATGSTNYLGASAHEISAKVSDIASGATGLATAAAVYSYAITCEAATDTTDYADVF